MSGILEMMQAIENTKKRLNKKANKELEQADFIQEIDKYIADVNIRRRDSYKPAKRCFKPSSISKCKRELFYYFKGYPEEVESITSQNQRILDLGNIVHEQMQEAYLRGLSNEFNTRGNFRLMTDEEIAERVPKETKLLSTNKTIEVKFYNELYNIKGFTDGMVYFQGKFYIFEFKTIKSSQFSKLKGKPKPEHLEQAITYSIALGLDDIIFLYYNKDNSALQCMFAHIDEDMKKSVIKKIKRVTEYVDKDELPPKEGNKCMYCRYKMKCWSELEKVSTNN